jgi:hypothetical protein
MQLIMNASQVLESGILVMLVLLLIHAKPIWGTGST